MDFLTQITTLLSHPRLLLQLLGSLAIPIPVMCDLPSVVLKGLAVSQYNV